MYTETLEIEVSLYVENQKQNQQHKKIREDALNTKRDVCLLIKMGGSGIIKSYNSSSLFMYTETIWN